MEIEKIATIENDYREKFGIPRQSGLVKEVLSCIIFEPKYRVSEALRGLEGVSHLWLIWGFSKSLRNDFSPTVRPPRLGGNVRMGVFATRSPFRPNGLGLSCVELVEIKKHSEKGEMLIVAGADLLSGSPIYDIKPYSLYADCHPEASDSTFSPLSDNLLAVDFPEELLSLVPQEKREALAAVLARDPRPRYQHDGDRQYGLSFGGVNVKFSVEGDILRVSHVEKE